MKRFVFAVRDRAADTFGAPFCDVARGSAIRSFRTGLNDPQSGALYQHPDDFDLYVLGTFDDSTGLFETGSPEMVAVGKDFAEREAKSSADVVPFRATN